MLQTYPLGQLITLPLSLEFCVSGDVISPFNDMFIFGAVYCCGVTEYDTVSEAPAVSYTVYLKQFVHALNLSLI